MLLFFDTEFTGLNKDTTLISLGIVSENGDKFYAEFLDYDKSQVDPWIFENVIKNLRFTKQMQMGVNQKDTNGNEVYLLGNKQIISSELRYFLSKFDEVQFVSDVCHYDFVLLIDIFGGAFDLPENVSPVCYDINQEIASYFNISQKEAFDKNREEMVFKSMYKDKISGEKHNALFDAEIIRYIYKIIHE